MAVLKIHQLRLRAESNETYNNGDVMTLPVFIYNYSTYYIMKNKGTLLIRQFANFRSTFDAPMVPVAPCSAPVEGCGSFFYLNVVRKTWFSER